MSEMNIPEALSRQVERVTTIRADYRALQKLVTRMPTNYAPAIHMMTASLEKAHKAAGSGNIGAIIAALGDLKGYEL